MTLLIQTKPRKATYIPDVQDERKGGLFTLLRKAGCLGWAACATAGHCDCLFQSFSVTLPCPPQWVFWELCSLFPSSHSHLVFAFLWTLKALCSLNKEVQSLPQHCFGWFISVFWDFKMSFSTFFSQATHTLGTIFFMIHYIKTMFSFSSVWLIYPWLFRITSGISWWHKLVSTVGYCILWHVQCPIHTKVSIT